MTVRAQFVVSVVVAAAAIGFVAHSARTEPFKIAGTFHSFPPSGRDSGGQTWNVAAVDAFVRTPKRDGPTSQARRVGSISAS